MRRTDVLVINLGLIVAQLLTLTSCRPSSRDVLAAITPQPIATPAPPIPRPTWVAVDDLDDDMLFAGETGPLLAEITMGGPMTVEEDMYLGVDKNEIPMASMQIGAPIKDGVLVTQWFHAKVTYQLGGLHTGVDLSSSVNSAASLYAVQDAVVEYVGPYWVTKPGTGLGPYAIVLLWYLEDGTPVRAIYGHSRAEYVEIGQGVAKGEHIADMGSLGNSTGPHVHFEIYIGGETTGDWARSPLRNGYYDDPMRYIVL